MPVRLEAVVEHLMPERPGDGPSMPEGTASPNEPLMPEGPADRPSIET